MDALAAWMHDMSDDPSAATPGEHPCPRGDDCAIGKGAVRCFACGRNWPPDETWGVSAEPRETTDGD